MSLSVAELHAAYPYDRNDRAWDYPESFEESIAIAGDLHRQDDPFAYLETVQREDEKRAAAISHALLYLPGDVVLENFGVSVAAWTVVNTFIAGKADHIIKALGTKAGFDLTDFHIAENWEYQHSSQDSATNVLAQYHFMQKIKHGLLDTVDLEAVLTDTTKEDCRLVPQQLGHYALLPIETKEYYEYYSGGGVKGWSNDVSPTLAYTMWLDTPVGFALMYKGLPNAMGGLAMVGPDESMLYQLQGVRGRRIDPSKSRYDDTRDIGPAANSWGLQPLDWRKTVVTIAEHIGKNSGLSSTAIQAAKNNVWIKKRMPHDKAPHLPLEIAREVYDGTAVRLGYSQIPDDRRGNWHKRVAHKMS